MVITFAKDFAKGTDSRTLADLVCSTVALVGVDYNDNLRCDVTWHRGRRVRFVIRARSSRAFGARRSWSGRRSVAASWEAHRDCMRALFRFDPNARLQTGMAIYRGAEGFERDHVATGYKNIGSQFQPATMRELSLDQDGD